MSKVTVKKENCSTVTIELSGKAARRLNTILESRNIYSDEDKARELYAVSSALDEADLTADGWYDEDGLFVCGEGY